MSQYSIVDNTGKQLFVNTDLSKIFIRDNRYESDNYINNSTYNPITLSAGTVMGRISATGILVPFTSTASDGSQYILGVLADDFVLGAGITQTAPVCVAGDVVADKLIFVLPGDGLETVVSGRRVKDKIQGETVAIKIVYSTEMTDFDNY